MFNAEEFLNQSIEGSLDTKVIPLPQDDYKGVVSDIDVITGEKDGNSWFMLIIKWKIIDEEALAKANRDGNPIVEQSLFLDMNSEGKLDTSPQKNVRLGKLRDALGQNDGSPWTFGMLMDQVAMCRLGHRPDRNDPETLYNEVKAVVPIN